MKKCYLFLCLFLFLANSSFGQSETFLDLSNKLLCNAYVYGKADSLTLKFLKENFPYLLQVTPEGGWVYAPMSVDATISLIPLKFKKHPFFDFAIKEGELDFKTVTEPDGSKSERGADLLLIFETETDAILAFTQLIDEFKKVSATKNIFENNGEKVAQFISNSKNNISVRAQFILSKDSPNNTYKIGFAKSYNDN